MIPTEETIGILDVISVVDALIECGYKIYTADQLWYMEQEGAQALAKANHAILFRYHTDKQVRPFIVACK